ncbi:hypothetical protein GYA13_03960 [Candidatus Kuenenbacteria bacterium]|nr:hypothetical protein [Candidatus Kuenenbacteria bacterium]
MTGKKFFSTKYCLERPGFTIIELVVCAGIIAMISTLIIANFQGSTQRGSLDNEAERLSSVLRQANINSLIGLTIAGGVRPAGGFGVHLDTCSSDCSYFIFADGNGDHLYDPNNPGDIIIQNLGMLDDNVYIHQLVLPLPEGQPQPASLDIAFVPPQGLVFINGVDTFEQAEVSLGFANSSYERTITLISKSGRINIQ